MIKTDISTLAQLQDFAKIFSQGIQKGDIIYLIGDLGSGKTTFVQMVLKNLGCKDRVKSPTYAIYEQYQINNNSVFHMDLYRLSNAEELYYLGIEEIITPITIVLIEWPEKGQGVLPQASQTLTFSLIDSEKREVSLEIR